MDSELLQSFIDTLDRSMKQALQASGIEAEFASLTTSQLRYLNAISDIGNNGPAAIAEYLRVSKSSATVAIERLATMNLVEKRPSLLDGRAVSVALTDQGQRLIGAKRRALENFAAHVAAVLCATDLEKLEAILTHLVESATK